MNAARRIAKTASVALLDLTLGLCWPVLVLAEQRAQPFERAVEVVSVENAGLTIVGEPDCVVHIVSSSKSAEQAQPCSVPVRLEDGSFWVEQHGLSTPFLTRVENGRASDRGPYPKLPLAPAGRMNVSLEHGLTEHDELVLLSLEERTHEGRLLPSFERRVSASSQESWLMPAGVAIAAIFDQRSGDAVALSRAVSVRAGGVTTALPARPASGGDLLLILERSEAPVNRSAALELTRDGEPVPAPLIAELAERVIAIWRDLPAGRYEVTARTDTTFLPRQEIKLAGRRVTTIRSALQPRPSLEVMISSEVPQASLPTRSLAIERAAGEPVADELEVDAAGPYRFEHLSPEPLIVELKAGEWTFSETADLSNGMDQRLTFSLDPITVRGTVYEGDERAAGRVGFLAQGGRWVEVATDDRGEYETQLWRPQRYVVRVVLENDDAREPWQDTARIVRDTTLDFRVPENSITVRVFDRGSGMPIEAASVAMKSSWVDEKEGKKSRGSGFQTDERGEVLLPPLRAGSLEFVASAEGYSRSPPFTRQIDAAQTVEVIEVPLDAEGEGARLTLLASQWRARGRRRDDCTRRLARHREQRRPCHLIPWVGRS